MELNFKSSSNDIQKVGQIFSKGKYMEDLDLSGAQQGIDNLNYPITIEVSPNLKKSEKVLAILVNIFGVITNSVGDELLESMYVDILTISDAKNSFSVEYGKKKPYFLIKDTHVKYEIQRKLKQSDYLMYIAIFLAPILILLSLTLFLFITSNNLQIFLKVGSSAIVAGLIIYVLYKMFSLYKKTK